MVKYTNNGFSFFKEFFQNEKGLIEIEFQKKEIEMSFIDISNCALELIIRLLIFQLVMLRYLNIKIFKSNFNLNS